MSKGFHHIPLGLFLAFFLGPLTNLFFWLGKELGEATMRAGGTKQAFGNWKAWEPWDFIYPTVAGYILTGLKIDEAIRTFFS